MGLKGKLEVEVEIKSSGDLLHELIGYNPHQVSDIIPDKFHACELHEGEYGKPGSVICWHYTLDGKKCVAKEIVEVVDIENKTVKCKVIEGELLEDYKSLTIGFHIIPKGEVSIVNWIIEFEKIHDDGAYPTNMMDLIIASTKGIESHHLKA